MSYIYSCALFHIPPHTREAHYLAISIVRSMTRTVPERKSSERAPGTSWPSLCTYSDLNDGSHSNAKSFPIPG